MQLIGKRILKIKEELHSYEKGKIANSL